MGCYADGHGSILFQKVLSANEREQIREILEEGFSEACCGVKDTLNGSRTIFYVSDYDNYHEDSAKDALERVSQIAKIKAGEIEYIGEAGGLWHFIYRGEKWIEENGYVVYGTPMKRVKIERSRIKKIYTHVRFVLFPIV